MTLRAFNHDPMSLQNETEQGWMLHQSLGGELTTKEFLHRNNLQVNSRIQGGGIINYRLFGGFFYRKPNLIKLACFGVCPIG